MKVHPAIEALRGDWASQRSAQRKARQSIESWQANKRTRSVAAEIRTFADGAALHACEALRHLLFDHRAALGWVQELFEPLMVATRQRPLGDLPLQTSCSDNHATIRLMAYGRVTLSVTAHKPRRNPGLPATALLVDRESTELILNGKVAGLLHQSNRDAGGVCRFVSGEHVWQAGDKISLTSEDARHFMACRTTILTLQLVRSAARPRPTCKHRLSDGALLKSASGDKQASRDLLALGVLGARPTREALDLMERLAHDKAGPVDLRWEALRQALAVDSERGFRLLTSVSRQGGDPLAEPANRLKFQLLAAHPSLSGLNSEAAQCLSQ